MRDEIDSALDTRLAMFVVDSHTLAHPDVQAQMRQLLSEAVPEAQAKARALAACGMSVSPAFLPTTEDESGNSGAGAVAAATGASGWAGGSGAGTAAGAVVSVGGSAPIPQALLKKYILEARALKPQLSGIDQDKVPQLYTELRRESEISGGIPIAVRHVESIFRMAEAAARMRLSSYVTSADLNLAIRVMLESFISAQKYNVTRTLRRHFSRYLDTGADFHQLLLLKAKELVKEKTAQAFVRSGSYAFVPADIERIEVRLSELQERARRHGIDDVSLRSFLSSPMFAEHGFSYDDARKVLIKVVR